MKIPRPIHALLAIWSPQLGPMMSVLILSVGTFSFLASASCVERESFVLSSLTWMRRDLLPSFWTIAVWPDASLAVSSACWAETEVVGVVKTAPPEKSMPMFRPRTARPTMAVMVMRIEMPYQIFRLATKS